MIENLKNATTEEIHEFLHGSATEQYIVALEYGYRTGKIYKIKECPVRGKIVETDTITPFCWVGNLSKKNFYQNNKQKQKAAMTKYGIIVDKLESGGNERLEEGLTYIIKTTKSYR